MTLHVTIVTPEKVLVDTEADELIVPTVTGELAILPQHVALFTQLHEGEIIIKHAGKQEELVVVGGFIEVSDKSVTVLADYAVLGREISATAAQQAKDRAEKAMKEKKSEVEYAQAELEFRRAIMELKLANRHRTSR
jgi:F-type H+-transporting ATPase subunit epsilon